MAAAPTAAAFGFFAFLFFFPAGDAASISMTESSAAASLAFNRCLLSTLRWFFLVLAPLTALTALACRSLTPASFLETRDLIRLFFCQLTVRPVAELLLVPARIDMEFCELNI